MKRAQNSKEMAKSQNREGISDVSTPQYEIHVTRQTKHKLPNIFLIQNKGKGPPGRQRSPGAVICRNPEHPPDVPTRLRFFNHKKSGYLSVLKRLNSEDLPWQDGIRRKAEVCVEIQPNFEIYKRTQITNFYYNLNFTIMKKQILILFVAIFASVTVSWGQGAKPKSAPVASTCIPDALHPVAGVPFTYKATVAAGTGTYEWWATKDPAFITAGGVTNMATFLKSPTSPTTGTDLLTSSANYAKTGQTSDEVIITWSDAILSTTKYQATPSATPTIANPSPTFVAVRYVGAGTECADNIKVYELDPINAFTVDIKNIDETTFNILGYGVKDDQCAPLVSKATYNNKAMEYEYGINYLYYEVVAANFTSYWVPTFAFSGQHAVQTYVIEYTYQDPATWGTTAPTWTPVVNATTHFDVDPTVTTTANGVSVFIRVTVTNHNYEGLATRTVTLAADGQNSVGTWDIVNSATACTQTAAADLNDKADQDLKPRPTVPSTTTSPTPPNTKLVTGNEQN